MVNIRRMIEKMVRSKVCVANEPNTAPVFSTYRNLKTLLKTSIYSTGFKYSIARNLNNWSKPTSPAQNNIAKNTDTL